MKITDNKTHPTNIPCKHSNYYSFPNNQTKDIIISKYHKNPIYFHINESIINLYNLFNNKKITTPARTTECKHVDVCELRVLYNYVLKNKVCPLCDDLKEIKVDMIYIDKIVNDIIQERKKKEDDGEFYDDIDYIIINKGTNKCRNYNNTTRELTECDVDINPFDLNKLDN